MTRPLPRYRAQRGRLLPFVLDALDPRTLMVATNASVDFAVTHQTIEGTGAAMISWVGQDVLPEYGQASFYDQLVNDLGASAVRGPVWPNFEVANDNNDPNVFDWTKFDSSQIQNVMTFFQRMKERGVKTFLLTVWTPPYWQKTNLSLQSGGQLRPDMRDEFAEYLAAVVIAAKRDFDIDVSAVSVQNEQFFNEWYESALLDNLNLRETVLAVQKKFKYEGLTTRILANEDVNGSNAHRWLWYNDPLLNDPQVDRSNLIVGSHTGPREGMPAQRDQLAGTGIPLWYSEVSGRPLGWWDALMTGADASDAFTQADATAYFYWQFSDTAPNATAALMANGVPNSKYQAIKHVFKYVRPGMQRVTSSIDNAVTRIGAYKDPKTGAETITMFNVSDFDAEVTLNLSNFADGTVFRAFASTLSAKWATLPNITAQGTLTFTLPKLSALTLYSGQDPTPVTGNGTAVQPPIYHIQDAVQSNPLRLASARGRLSEVQALIASGADVNAADPITGWTALHAAAASPFPDAPAIMSALLAAGANALAVDFRGATTLHALTMNLWQEWQADYNALIVRNNGKADLLLNAGVDINARDAQGRTPMHWAAMLPNMYSEYGHLNQTLQYLLNHGADRSAIDTFGKSAYDYSTTEFRSAYADMLRWPTPFYDTRGPITRFAKYNLDKNQIDLTFTENAAASLTASDLVLRNIATNQIVSGWTLSTSFSFGITVAKITLAARLPTGQYRLTLAAGAIADQNGIVSNVATTVDFTSLAGDATGDGVVNFDDLLRFSQSYGRSGTTWSQGDFDGDGTVDFDDLLMLAQNYGLSAFVSPVVATATSRKSNTR